MTITLTVIFGFDLFGDAVPDALDPKLRSQERGVGEGLALSASQSRNTASRRGDIPKGMFNHRDREMLTEPADMRDRPQKLITSKPRAPDRVLTMPGAVPSCINRGKDVTTSQGSIPERNRHDRRKNGRTR